MINRLLLLLITGSLTTSLSAQTDNILPLDSAYKRHYTITKVQDIVPILDGKLNDKMWVEQGVWSDSFVQIIPYEREPTPSFTRVKLFYDNKYI